MTFTALHRAIGAAPGPLIDELLDAAVSAGVAEAVDLDWKSTLPPAKGLPQTDFPKDVAAMANSGGGLIVFGVHESQKAATGRVDVGEVSEVYERSLHSAAITAISPPVFGLNVQCLGPEGKRAVVVEVPASIDGPHLIYRNDYFGAPIRNDSDTVWMKERQIEAMYRARFDERRHATEALDNLYVEAAAGRGGQRAWLVAVAHPRVPRLQDRLTREGAKAVLSQARGRGLLYTDGADGVYPLENMDLGNPRPGLRRWVAPTTTTGEQSVWKESWASLHFDGSVSLAAAVGGYPGRAARYFEGWQVWSSAIELAVADYMALVRSAAEATDNDEYDLRVGIKWTGDHPLSIFTTDQLGYPYDGSSTPLHTYTAVDMSVNATASELDFHWCVHNLAQDCVNQGGISNLQKIRPPDGEGQAE